MELELEVQLELEHFLQTVLSQFTARAYKAMTVIICMDRKRGPKSVTNLDSVSHCIGEYEYSSKISKLLIQCTIHL